MTNGTTVFGLEIIYDDSTDEEGVPTPALSIFASAAIAANRRQGIDITEGDLYFFAADGSPLEADFSEKPYIDNTKYFAGVYSLRPGAGGKLHDALTKIISSNETPDTAVIVYQAEDDEDAQWHGWQDRNAMVEGTKKALRILPVDLLKRVKLE